MPFSEDPFGNLERMLLPALALALPILANLSRLVRSAMLDALGQDYVRTARAKGLSERRVVYKHALRNALIPFITSVGIMTGYLLGGAIVVEQVFAIPGLGRLILGAIAERNYPLIQATHPRRDGRIRAGEFSRRHALHAGRSACESLMPVRVFAETSSSTFALVLVAIQLILAVGAPWVAPYDPMAQSVARRLRGPTALNWLGTDQLGRDVLTRILYGYRTSLIACLIAVGIALLAGGTLGLISAYYRGWLDRIVMRLMDVLFAFPVMLLAIGIIAVLGPHTYSAAAAIAVVYTPIFARLLRGPALVLCESEYVAGARAIGASDARIIFMHILPNLASVDPGADQPAAVRGDSRWRRLCRSSASAPSRPRPLSGLMLSEGRNFLLLSPWSAIFAGFGILFLSFGFNLLGDALRDTLDPRLRGQP